MAFDSLNVGRLERLIALRSFAAYSALSAEDVGAMAAIAVERRWRAGDRILEEGHPVTHLHFVIRGRVELRRQGLTLRQYGPQSVVGGIAALAEDPDGYDVIALEDTITLEVPADENTELFEEHFEAVRGVLQGIARQTLILRHELGTGAGFNMSEWVPSGPPPEPLDLVGRMAMLREAMPFAGTRLEAIADLAREVRELRLDDQDELWAAGDPSDSFVFISWGIVEATTRGGEVKMRFGPGDVVGSLGTLANEPRWYTAKAAGGLVGLRLAGETMLDVFEDHFDLALAMMRASARGLLALTIMAAESARAAQRDSDIQVSV